MSAWVKFDSGVGGYVRHAQEGKNAVRKIALYKTGSCNLSQALEMLTRVSRSKVPLGMGLKVEFIEILLIYAETNWWCNGSGSHLYLTAAVFKEEI